MWYLIALLTIVLSVVGYYKRQVLLLWYQNLVSVYGFVIYNRSPKSSFRHIGDKAVGITFQHLSTEYELLVPFEFMNNVYNENHRYYTVDKAGVRTELKHNKGIAFLVTANMLKVEAIIVRDLDTHEESFNRGDDKVVAPA